MSKKDYELIAGVLREHRATAVTEMIADNDHWEELACGQDSEEAEESGRLAGVVEGIEQLAAALASALSTTNPLFQRDRFIAACMGEDSHDMAGRKVRYSQDPHAGTRS